MMATPCARLLLVFSLIALPQIANAMRCGSRIVQTGDSVLKMLEHCGEPALKSRDTELRTRRLSFADVQRYGLPERYIKVEDAFEVTEIIEIETWHYNFGRNRLIHIVKLEDNMIVDIETDGYGY